MASVRLLVLCPSLPGTSPGSRFRIEQWIPHLEARGVSVQLSSFEDQELHSVIYERGRHFRKARLLVRALVRRLRLLRGLADRFDAVFIYEEAARLGPAIIERVLARMRVPVVYDFCDPIWIPYVSPINRHLARLKFPGKTATICRLSAHVLVGNEELAAYARRFNPRVTIVPITIDTDCYRPSATQRQPEVPVVGWSGSHSTVPHLDTFRPVLVELARRRRFTLRVIGTSRYEVPGVTVDARDWRLESEVEDLASFDVGVMPLPDDRWTRLRSHLKVRQYMGLGLPSVVSPVGVNRELVQDGINGYLAKSAEEWLSRLIVLLDDRVLRSRIGHAARQTIEERFSAREWSGVVLQVISEAASLRGGGAART
jgi:glycosyltransferase involved in cell wall biosynthesis